jgi:hypothetical protein
MTGRLPDAHSMNRPASSEGHPQRRRSVPIAYEDRLVVIAGHILDRDHDVARQQGSHNGLFRVARTDGK